MMIDLTTGIKVVAVVDTQEEAITTEAAGPRAAGGPEGVVEETEGVVNKITEHPETVTLEEMTILETEKDSKKGIHYISKLYWVWSLLFSTPYNTRGHPGSQRGRGDSRGGRKGSVFSRLGGPEKKQGGGGVFGRLSKLGEDANSQNQSWHKIMVT